MNPYIGVSQAQLETWLREAQEDLAAGKTVTAAGAGDTNFQNQVSADPKDRIRLLLVALNRLDSETYPSADIARVSRTRISVYDSGEN